MWGAHDRDTDVVYLWSEHYRGQAEPSVHAAAIRARGEWMQGAIDPAARGRGQRDGEQLLQNYIDLGLLLTKADNGVEAGLFDVWQRLSTGRLKVFRTLQHWLAEYRLYRRDEKGAVVKKDDHLMDATRYFIVSGLPLCLVAPDAGRRLVHESQHQSDDDPFEELGLAAAGEEKHQWVVEISVAEGTSERRYNPLGSPWPNGGGRMSFYGTRGGRSPSMRRDSSVLIPQIYDAVEDSEVLPAVLSGLCERIGGQSAMLGILMKAPGPAPLPVSLGLDPAVMQTLYARHLDNVWRRHMDALPVGNPVASDSLVPLERVRRTDFYGDVLEPWNIGHSAWFSLGDTRKHRVAMSINRSLARGPFTPAELQASHELLPHLRRAMQLRSLLDRPHDRQRLALGVLDRLASGVLIVDGNARVLFANVVAEEIVGARDVLVVTGAAIRPRQRELGDAFQRLLDSAVVGRPGGALLLRRPSRRLPVSVLVTPLAGTLAASLSDQGRRGAAAIFLSDPERQEVPEEHLRALYRLSATEARVAWLTTRSGSIGSAAKVLGIAPETVRTHLKHVYAKTGVNRQSALAHLLATAAVVRPL